jgi:hypothetical protein
MYEKLQDEVVDCRLMLRWGVAGMSYYELSIHRVRTILFWIQRLFLFLLVVGLCCLLSFEFGRFVLFFIGSFIAASFMLSISLYKGILLPTFRGVQCPSCQEWGLVHVASISFGNRFSRCDSRAVFLASLRRFYTGACAPSSSPPVPRLSWQQLFAVTPPRSCWQRYPTGLMRHLVRYSLGLERLPSCS